MDGFYALPVFVTFDGDDVALGKQCVASLRRRALLARISVRGSLITAVASLIKELYTLCIIATRTNSYVHSWFRFGELSFGLNNFVCRIRWRNHRRNDTGLRVLCLDTRTPTFTLADYIWWICSNDRRVLRRLRGPRRRLYKLYTNSVVEAYEKTSFDSLL